MQQTKFNFFAIPATALLILSGCATRSASEADLKNRLEKLEQRFALISKTLGIRDDQEIVERPFSNQDIHHNIPIDDSPVLGSSTAPHTVTIFVDMTCGFCNQAFTTITEILNRHSDDYRIVIKHFPLLESDEARAASRAALAASQQGRYFEMISELFANQESFSALYFLKAARKIGLDETVFARNLQYDAEKLDAQINRDKALGNSLGVRGTPTIYLDGYETNNQKLRYLLQSDSRK